MPGPEIGQVFNDTYRLERLLGRGAMGAVYEVSHLRLPRRFAMKILNVGDTHQEELIARFRREAEISSRLKHPNVLDVMDFNEGPDESFYIVMELLEGEDLRSRLKKMPEADLPFVRSVLRQVADALDHVHAQGVVHRDLKPDNLFVCHNDHGEELIKVVDFGISKLVDEAQIRITGSSAVLGTPMYMAPEQAAGDSARSDPRTDVYAMGVILYEMLAGRAPFRADSASALLVQVLVHDPPAIHGRRADVTEALDAVVRKAIAKEPDERFSSMKELHEAFEAAVDAPFRATATVESSAETPDLPVVFEPEDASPEGSAPEASEVDEVRALASVAAATGVPSSDAIGSPSASRLPLWIALGTAAALGLFLLTRDEPAEVAPLSDPVQVNKPSFVVKPAQPAEEAPDQPEVEAQPNEDKEIAPPIHRKSRAKPSAQKRRKPRRIRDGLMEF